MNDPVRPEIELKDAWGITRAVIKKPATGALSLTERVAAAMFNAPDPAEPETVKTPWPPSHPDDLAWWLTRAQAAINAIKEL